MSLSGEKVPTDLRGKGLTSNHTEIYFFLQIQIAPTAVYHLHLLEIKVIFCSRNLKNKTSPPPLSSQFFSSTWHKVNEVQWVLIRALMLFQDPETRYFGIPVPFLSDLFAIVESFDPWQPVASWAPQCDHWVFFLPPSCMRNKWLAKSNLTVSVSYE